MKDTRVDLVKELSDLVYGGRGAPGAVKTKRIRQIIEKAKRGDYHCFKSTLAMPKVELVEDLRAAHLNVLASRVANGEFDEAPDAEDRAALALELSDHPEVLERLQLPKPIKG